MSFHKKVATLVFCSLLFLTGLCLLFATPGSSRAASRKYEKCHAKCVQRYGDCMEDAAEIGNRNKRIKKKAECETRKKECAEKCED